MVVRKRGLLARYVKSKNMKNEKYGNMQLGINNEIFRHCSGDVYQLVVM